MNPVRGDGLYVLVPDVPPAPDELAALRAANARLREVVAAKDELLAARDAQIAALAVQVAALTAQVGELERQLARDSSNSSRPPSSDSPYQKKGGGRSLRERGKRRPGKQPGGPGWTMCLADDPDERIECPPAVCCGCGADLASAPVTAQRRHQVTDIAPAPAPKVTEYSADAW